jgi:hypothetical protein
MLNPRCAYCDVEITPANQSREHIIQNAIGGRKEVSNVFCRACNSAFGNCWDSEAANQLHFLSLKLQVVRDDGEAPARDYRTMNGQNVRLHPDGHITLPPQEPLVTEKDGKVHIQINAPNRRKALESLKGQKRRYPKLDVQAAIDSVAYRETYLDDPVFVSLQFGTDASYRSVVKSALTLAVSGGIQAKQCERALQYLRPKGEFCFGLYYRRDLVINRPADRVFHCVAIKGDPENRRLVGYVELFSIYRFVVCLSENYDGQPVADSYSVDPTTGETLALTFDLDFSEDEFRFAVENLDETTAAAQGAAVRRVVEIVQRRSFDREQERVLRKAYDDTLKKLGLEPGQEMTPEIAMAMSKEITSRVLPFLKHRISAQAGGGFAKSFQKAQS